MTTKLTNTPRAPVVLELRWTASNGSLRFRRSGSAGWGYFSGGTSSESARLMGVVESRLAFTIEVSARKIPGASCVTRDNQSDSWSCYMAARSRLRARYRLVFCHTDLRDLFGKIPYRIWYRRVTP